MYLNNLLLFTWKAICQLYLKFHVIQLSTTYWWYSKQGVKSQRVMNRPRDGILDKGSFPLIAFKVAHKC